MRSSAALAKFKVPLTAQEIELVQLDFSGGPQEGGRSDSVPISELRVRIRERARFTTLDLDPVTAAHLGGLLCRWAQAQQPQAIAALDEPCAHRSAKVIADG